MDILNAICARRSVRAYQAKSVDLGLLTLLLEAATFAPSAMNEQP